MNELQVEHLTTLYQSFASFADWVCDEVDDYVVGVLNLPVRMPIFDAGEETIAAWALWKAWAEPDQSILIMHQNFSRPVISRRIIERMLSSLPDMLRPGVIQNNSRIISLDNGSLIMFGAANSNSLRGRSLNHVILDGIPIDSSKFAELIQYMMPSLSFHRNHKIIIMR